MFQIDATEDDSAPTPTSRPSRLDPGWAPLQTEHHGRYTPPHPRLAATPHDERRQTPQLTPAMDDLFIQVLLAVIGLLTHRATNSTTHSSDGRPIYTSSTRCDRFADTSRDKLHARICYL